LTNRELIEHAHKFCPGKVKVEDMITNFEEGAGIKLNLFHPLDVYYNELERHWEWTGLALCDVISGSMMDKMQDPVKEVSKRLNSFNTDRFLALMK
jgi:hypothetical protein